jgi:hypothetical protein
MACPLSQPWQGQWCRCENTTVNSQSGLMPNTSPKAIADLKADGVLPESVQLRQIKYLNTMIERDHRFIKRLVLPHALIPLHQEFAHWTAMDQTGRRMDVLCADVVNRLG